MADTFTRLAQVSLNQAVGTIYTVPAATSVIVKSVHVVNVSGAQTTITLYQSGTGTANQLLAPTTLATGEYGVYDGTITMAAGDTLSGSCSQNSGVTVTVEGMTVT
jgi:hypothetical protein